MRRNGVLGALLVTCIGCEQPPVAATDGGAVDANVPPDLSPPPDLFMVTGPALLSQSGLYSDFGSRTLAPSVVEYSPRYLLWSDGAEKNRYLLLPQNAKIDTSNMDDWIFPVGTKIWKQFTVPAAADGGSDGGAGVVVETRLLWKQYDSPQGWWEVAYVWKADGSDAVATPAGAEDPLSTIHRVPSQDDCSRCHGNLHDVPIGLSAIQLSSPDGKSGFLTKLAGMGVLTNPPQSEFQPPGQGLVQDALGYLHGNCGHCHNNDWPLRKAVQLRMRLSVLDATPEGSPVYVTGIKAKMHHDMPGVGMIGIVPGDPDHSQLLARMSHRDDGWEMPPVCTKLVDADGMKTIHDWIAGLP